MLEYYEDAERFVMVLELCTGGELFDRIMEARSGSPSVQRFLDGFAHCGVSGHPLVYVLGKNGSS